MGVLSILSQVEESDGNYKKALFYERLYSNYSDSLNMEWRNNLVQNLERKYRTEYFQKSYAALKKTSLVCNGIFDFGYCNNHNSCRLL